MSRLSYLFYFFGILLIVGGVFGNNLPMFLLGVLLALSSLSGRKLRRSKEQSDSSDDILSLIFDGKEKKLMQALMEANRPLRLGEVATITGLNKVTTYRLLKRLVNRGAVLTLKVNANSPKEYYLNPKLRKVLEQKEN